jgi:PTS system nitrogen regulatory IIA component
MNIKDIILPNLTAFNAKEHLNKKKVLEEIGDLICHEDTAIKYPDVLEALQQREKIGSTAIGHGVAIPHARVPGLKNPLCAVLTLQYPINFCDQETALVDIIFCLVVPEDNNDEHVKMLALIAERLKEKTYRTTLRQATSNSELYAAITE